MLTRTILGCCSILMNWDSSPNGYMATVSNVAEKMQQLNRNIRLVFDYLHLSENSTRGITP